jgi:biotin carboxylase
MDDYTTVAICDRRARIEDIVAIAVPPADALASTRDKLATIRLAEEVGVETPATRCPKDAAEVEALATEVSYPCVLKPRRGLGGFGMRVVGTPRDLVEAYATRPVGKDLVFDYDSVLIQEFVPGEVHDVCVLFRHGEPRTALTQRRLVMYPRSGGGGILNETTCEPELAERAYRLLGALGWHGPAQVEFKVDAPTGRVWLMEINGRFWGALALAVAAGLDFPRMTARMAIDGDVEPAFSYAVGKRYRWTTAYGLLAVLESDRRWRTAWDFFGPARGTASDLCLRDPLPHIAELSYAARRLWERRSLRPLRGADRRELTSSR